MNYFQRKKLAAAANKAKNYDDENEEEEEGNEVLEEDESSSESEEEQTEKEEGNSGSSCRMFPPFSDREAILYLRSAWSEINLPVQEKDLQEKYFATIYYPDGNRKKKPKLFVAKFLNCFLADADGATSSVNLDRPFELTIGSSTVLSERPPHLKDTGNFEAYDRISVPLKVTFIGHKKWDVPAYPNVVKTFNIVLKLCREEIYCQLYDLSAIPKKT